MKQNWVFLPTQNINKMKIKLLLLIGLTIGTCATLQAQSIPNGSFENWSGLAYDDAPNWYTSNIESLKLNTITASKVAGVSGFAIKLQTKVVGNDTLGGFFMNTLIDDPTQGKGGQPYNQKAQTISGKYMANMVGNDSAILFIMFKKSGVALSMDLFKFGGKNDTVFKSFTLNLNLSYLPDTVIIAAASSNLISNTGVQDGSSIVFDDLVFSGLGVTRIIPNGNFDTWTPKIKDIATGWSIQGGVVTKDTSSYRGNYAIKLESIDFGFGEVEAGQISTGTMGPLGFLVGGKPFTNSKDTLCGYYKLSSSTGDSAMITYTLSKNGSFIQEETLSLKAKASYTYFEFPINATSAPDNIRVDVQSLYYPFSFAAKSILYLDHLQLKSAPLPSGVKAIYANATNHIFYPNPVVNSLTIELDALNNAINQISIFDINGKLVLEQRDLNQSTVSINTSGFNSGIYFYIAETQSGQILRNKFIRN